MDKFVNFRIKKVKASGNKDLQNLAIDFKKNKDEKSFNKIYNILTVSIFKYIYNILKDVDLTWEAHNEAFSKMFSQIETFDEGYKFTTWVYTISKNEAYSVYNRYNKIKKQEVYLYETNVLTDYSVGYEEDSNSRSKSSDKIDLSIANYMGFEVHRDDDIYSMLKDNEITSIKYELALNLIEELPEVYRDLVKDKYVLGIKQVDLERLHNINLSTIKNRMRVALRMLNRRYKESALSF